MPSDLLVDFVASLLPVSGHEGSQLCVGALEKPDPDPLMHISTRRHVRVADKLLIEGIHPDAIYLVLEGQPERVGQGPRGGRGLPRKGEAWP